MEKVDLIPLGWVVISDRPSLWGNAGIMMWCRRCRTQIGDDATKEDAASLTELVKIADVHQEFYCPNPDESPDWSWRPTDHPEHQRIRLQFGGDLEEVIAERVNEALSAQKLLSKTRR
jgi:hypothetical protein